MYSFFSKIGILQSNEDKSKKSGSATAASIHNRKTDMKEWDEIQLASALQSFKDMEKKMNSEENKAHDIKSVKESISLIQGEKQRRKKEREAKITKMELEELFDYIETLQQENSDLGQEIINEEIKLAKREQEIKIRKKRPYDRDKLLFNQWLKKRKTYHGKMAEVWKTHDRIFKSDNHVYESVENYGTLARVGSIYYGKGNGEEGGRLRLLHPAGPRVHYSDSVQRYHVDEDNIDRRSKENCIKDESRLEPIQVDEKSGLKSRTSEQPYRIWEKMEESSHLSRGYAKQLIRLKAEEYGELLYAVEFAEFLTKLKNIYNRNRTDVVKLREEWNTCCEEMGISVPIGMFPMPDGNEFLALFVLKNLKGKLPMNYEGLQLGGVIYY